MYVKEKALMRKIKKAEKKKLARIQAKVAEKETEETNIDDNTDDPPLKKRKIRKEENSSEEEEKAEGNEETKSENVADKDMDSETESTEENPDFDSLKDKISENTMKAISEMGFTRMTEIQAKSIPLLLKFTDIFGTAKTGSGKTLAFLIHAVEFVYKFKFKQYTGTGVIILTPTRELAMQTYGVLSQLMKYHTQTFGLIMGGGNRKAEAKKLSDGVNILIATPGRLLDHMKTADFYYKHCACLIIDEADRILNSGFEKEVYEIYKKLNAVQTNRQTVLFSATRGDKTQTLMKHIFKNPPVYITVGDITNQATVSGLKQGFFICPPEHRFRVLFTFLNKYIDKKVMVFFNSCASAKFHADLLNCIDLPVKCIHGKQKQNIRTRTFFQFCNADSAILFCTDVAARGWDIPEVDWIVQFDPPTDPREYIHRVGRTARGEGSRGNSLLFLREEELPFVAHLQEAKVDVQYWKILWEDYPDEKVFQRDLDTLVSTNYYLLHHARLAFEGFLSSYKSLPWKEIFNVTTLDESRACRSFGLLKPTLNKK